MAWFPTILTITGVTLVIYSTAMVFPPLAFMAGGFLLLRAAWTLDDGGEQ